MRFFQLLNKAKKNSPKLVVSRAFYPLTYANAHALNLSHNLLCAEIKFGTKNTIEFLMKISIKIIL